MTLSEAREFHGHVKLAPRDLEGNTEKLMTEEKPKALSQGMEDRMREHGIPSGSANK
jgi:hypothetical protein